MKHWMKKNAKWLLMACFSLQLIGVASVVWKYFSTQSTGELYRFQTQPIDPRDPFRGQYVALDFTVNGLYPFKACESTTKRYQKRKLYAALTRDDEGFAKITGVSAQKPKHSDYLTVVGRYCGYNENKGNIRVTVPFDRFYANEFEALAIETQARDNPESTYLNVWVDAGDYAVGDLVLGAVK